VFSRNNSVPRRVPSDGTIKLLTAKDLDARSAVPRFGKDRYIFLEEQTEENVRTNDSICTGTIVCYVFCSSANVSSVYLLEQWNSIIIIIIIYFLLFFFFFFCV
jgi:hypothetical protein